MDKTPQAKQAIRAAQEILRLPKIRENVKLAAAKLILEYEMRQAELADRRAARKHQKQDQREQIAKLRADMAALREQQGEVPAGETQDDMILRRAMKRLGIEQEGK